MFKKQQILYFFPSVKEMVLVQTSQEVQSVGVFAPVINSALSTCEDGIPSYVYKVTYVAIFPRVDMAGQPSLL